MEHEEISFQNIQHQGCLFLFLLSLLYLGTENLPLVPLKEAFCHSFSWLSWLLCTKIRVLSGCFNLCSFISLSPEPVPPNTRHSALLLFFLSAITTCALLFAFLSLRVGGGRIHRRAMLAPCDPQAALSLFCILSASERCHLGSMSD